MILPQSVLIGRCPLVSEDSSALLFTVTLDESIPEVVAQFMPEMSHERPLRFAESHSSFLPLNVVRLENIDRNATVFMSGMDRMPRISLEFK